MFIQTQSNQNPFITSSTVGLKMDTSNAVLRVLNGSNSSTYIQDFGSVKLLMSYSNGSNQISNTVQLDSNCGLSRVGNLSITKDISSPALASTACNVYVNSNAYTGGDVVCSKCLRANYIQIGGGIPIDPATAVSGLYAANGKLVMTADGQLYTNDAISMPDLASGCISMPTVQSTASWAGSYSRSIFTY